MKYLKKLPFKFRKTKLNRVSDKKFIWKSPNDRFSPAPSTGITIGELKVD